MLTLRTLKELIDTPEKGEKLPTPKQLRTGESPVVAHKTTGTGVNEVHIIVYQSGYAVYGIGNRATVFQRQACCPGQQGVPCSSAAHTC